MAAVHSLDLINNWDTTRFELLNTRVCDMNLRIEGSPLEPQVERVCRELAAKGIRFRPDFYLTDSWGCPNEVPTVGVPFYLADSRLARIEEEQTGEVEDRPTVLMYLRHEAGHAVNYAYRLWRRQGWTDHFGSFHKPYRDVFSPDPASREFVRHIVHSKHGRSYAQKHPDEDFAETFAVWLTPRMNWRRRYRFWPALEKLKYVDHLMHEIRGEEPSRTGGKRLAPVEEMNLLLVEHYGQRLQRYRAAAQGYVDDKLKEIFPSSRTRKGQRVAELVRRNEARLVATAAQWSGLDEEEILAIVGKLETRAGALRLRYSKNETVRKLMDLAALTTALAMDFSYTGRFTG